MEKNNIDIKQIKDKIADLKQEIIEKEAKVDELLKILNNETDLDNEFTEED